MLVVGITLAIIQSRQVSGACPSRFSRAQLLVTSGIEKRSQNSKALWSAWELARLARELQQRHHIIHVSSAPLADDRASAMAMSLSDNRVIWEQVCLSWSCVGLLSISMEGRSKRGVTRKRRGQGPNLFTRASLLGRTCMLLYKEPSYEYLYLYQQLLTKCEQRSFHAHSHKTLP